jgi:16S rRNA C967 or C1407 C5-methylase (RsmB/RsmF family)
VCVRRRDRLGERVERAGVNVARLEYDDRRLVAAFVERRLQRVSTQPPCSSTGTCSGDPSPR